MFSNANSFKAKIKNMAKDRGIPAQQLQQNFLIEQVLKLIAKSSYKDSFIVKGGYLIGQLIGLDKRTTMDLDVTLKGTALSYVLPGEKVEPGEIVTEEDLKAVLEELRD